MPRLDSDNTVSVVPSLDNILESLGIGVLVQGPRAEIYYSNDAAPRLLGLSIDQLLGRTSFDPSWNVVHPDGSPFPGPEHPVPQAIATLQPVRGVTMGVYHPLDRMRRWLLVDAIPYLREDGALLYVVCSFVDITEQRKLEILLQGANTSLEEQVAQRTEALQRSLGNLAQREQLYRSVFLALSEGIVVHDAAGLIVDANPAAEQVLGLTIDQLQGRSELDPRWRLEEASGADLDPETIPSRVSQRDGVSVRERILAVHRPTGDRTLLSINSEPVIPDPGSPPTMVVATFEDVTLQHQTQAALAEGSARLERIAAMVPGLLLELTWDGSAPLEISFSGGVGLSWIVPAGTPLRFGALLEAAVPSDRPLMSEALRGAQENLRAVDLRLRLRGPDQAARWVQLQATAERTEAGGRIYALLQDIDRQVRAQKKQTIGELSAGIAHNFNNMLAAILPNLEDALGQVPAALKPQLQDAVTAAQGAAELVRQLLLYAQQDPGTDLQVVDLTSITHGALRIAQRTFERRIAIEVRVPPRHRLVRGKPTLIQQVLLNLLLNARDALDGAARPQITLSAAEGTLDDGRPAWLLSVSDNGPGMSAETLARLGEPFFTTKGPQQGMGMGMATAMGIARDHGGRITFRSEPGAGATFTFWLPQSTQPLSTPPPVVPKPLDGRQVLVIDDDRLVRTSQARLLGNLGATVLEAADGTAGIATFIEHTGALDAVLLDLTLPGASGAELLPRFKQLNPAVPVIIVSGYVDPTLPMREAFAVLQKPVRLTELLRTLHSAFST